MTGSAEKHGSKENDATIRVQKLLESRGRKTLEVTRKLMLDKRKLIRSKEVQKAIRYFATKYWTDLARPALMSLACEAVGGNSRKANQIAIPIMLVTAGVDIHDDIIDQSVEKNGRQTVYGKFGNEISLLLGDALLFEGFVRLSSSLGSFSRRKASRILGIFESTFFELGDAEAIELSGRAKLDTNPKDYLQIVKRKAADVEAYTHISALLAKATADKTRALCTYGRTLGMLAILRDDILDALDEEEILLRLEKEVPPLPILFAAQDQVAKQSIMAIMARDKKTAKDAEEIISIVTKSNGLVRTKEEMRKLRQKGLVSITNLKYRKAELGVLLDVLTNV